VKECGLTWEQVYGLNAYERLLLLGYETKPEPLPKFEMPKNQKKIAKGSGGLGW